MKQTSPMFVFPPLAAFVLGSLLLAIGVWQALVWHSSEYATGGSFIIFCALIFFGLVMLGLGYFGSD